MTRSAPLSLPASLHAYPEGLPVALARDQHRPPRLAALAVGLAALAVVYLLGAIADVAAAYRATERAAGPGPSACVVAPVPTRAGTSAAAGWEP